MNKDQNQEIESPKFNPINTESNNSESQNSKYNNTKYFESNYSSSSSQSQTNNPNITFGKSGNFLGQDSANNSSHRKSRIYTSQTSKRENAPQTELTNNKSGTVSSYRNNGTITRNTGAEITSKNAEKMKQISKNRNDPPKKEEKKSYTQPVSRRNSPKKSDNNNFIYKNRNNNYKKDENNFIQQEEKTIDIKKIDIGKEVTKLLINNINIPNTYRNYNYINNQSKTSNNSKIKININSSLKDQIKANISFQNNNLLETNKSNINEGKYRRTFSQISNINNSNPKEKGYSNNVVIKKESNVDDKINIAKNENFSNSLSSSDKIKATQNNYSNPTKAKIPKIENNNNISTKNISQNNKLIITTNIKNNNINSVSDKNNSMNIQKDSLDNESLSSSEQRTNKRIDNLIEKLDVYISNQEQYNFTQNQINIKQNQINIKLDSYIQYQIENNERLTNFLIEQGEKNQKSQNYIQPQNEMKRQERKSNVGNNVNEKENAKKSDRGRKKNKY